jgi:putative colanic acid biosynthesis UDP-glucose lipid carrier transferase
MDIEHARLLKIISNTTDLLVLNCFLVAGYIYLGPEFVITPNHLIFFVYLNIIWLILSANFGMFREGRVLKGIFIPLIYLQLSIFFFFLFLMFFQAVPLNYYPKSWLKWILPAMFIAMTAAQMMLYYTYIYYRRRIRNRRVLIVGQGESAQRLFRYFQENPWQGYKCLGMVALDFPVKAGALGVFSNLPKLLKENYVEEVYIAIEELSGSEKELIGEWLNNYPVKVRLAPDFGSFSYQSSELRHFGNIPVVALHPGPLSFVQNRLIKRAFDLTISVLVIVGILSWMTLLLFILDRLFYRQGVFFTQKRTSLNGKNFTIIKYRSMWINSLADKQQAVENDHRITPMGLFLRKTNIDELPQFLNVFMGDMSVVGPRPHMLEHTETYRRLVDGYMIRHLVKPGITGLAQVNGFRGEVKQVEDIQKRVEMDIEYVRNWTFLMDAFLILKTIWITLTGAFYASKSEAP